MSSQRGSEVNPGHDDWFIRLQDISSSIPPIILSVQQLLLKSDPAKHASKNLMNGGVVLGRRSSSAPSKLDQGILEIDSPIISRSHAQLTITPRGYVYVTDLGSLHGTSVYHPTPITLAKHSPLQLCHGDILTLGKIVTSKDVQYGPVQLKVVFRYPSLGTGKISGARDLISKPLTQDVARYTFAKAEDLQFLKRNVLMHAEFLSAVQDEHPISYIEDDSDDDVQLVSSISSQPPVISIEKHIEVIEVEDGAESICSIQTTARLPRDVDSDHSDAESNDDPTQTKTNKYGIPPSMLSVSDDDGAWPRGSSESAEDDDSMTDCEDGESNDEAPDIMGVREVEFKPLEFRQSSSPPYQPAISSPVAPFQPDISSPMDSPFPSPLRRPSLGRQFSHCSSVISGAALWINERSVSPEPTTGQPQQEDESVDQAQHGIDHAGDSQADEQDVDNVDEAEDESVHFQQVAEGAVDMEPVSSGLGVWFSYEESVDLNGDDDADHGDIHDDADQEGAQEQEHHRASVQDGANERASTPQVETTTTPTNKRGWTTSSSPEPAFLPCMAISSGWPAMDALMQSRQKSNDMENKQRASSIPPASLPVSSPAHHPDYSSDDNVCESDNIYSDNESGSSVYSSNDDSRSDGSDSDSASDEDDNSVRQSDQASDSDLESEAESEHVKRASPVTMAELPHQSEYHDTNADEEDEEGYDEHEDSDGRSESMDIEEDGDEDRFELMSGECDNEESDVEEEGEDESDGSVEEEEDDEAEGDEEEERVADCSSDVEPKIEASPSPGPVKAKSAQPAQQPLEQMSLEAYFAPDVSPGALAQVAQVDVSGEHGPSKEGASSAEVEVSDYVTPPDHVDGSATKTTEDAGLDSQADSAQSARAQHTSTPHVVEVETEAKSGTAQEALVELTRTRSISSASSVGLVTPPSNKRTLPDEFIVNPTCSPGASSDVIAGHEAAVQSQGQERPVKRIKRIGSSIGLIVLGAALGSVGTIAGLMQLGEE